MSRISERLRYTDSGLRVSPFYFSIFVDVNIFTGNFHPFSRGKPSSTRTTQTGKSNTNFLTHREAEYFLTNLNYTLLLNCFFRNNYEYVILIICLICSVTRFGTFFYQIRLDALRQHPLLYIIATFRAGGGSPTTSKQLW